MKFSEDNHIPFTGDPRARLTGDLGVKPRASRSALVLGRGAPKTAIAREATTNAVVNFMIAKDKRISSQKVGLYMCQLYA